VVKSGLIFVHDYVWQTAELGDYDCTNGRDYISKLKMIPKQALKHEDKVAEFHKSLK
jgi:hypothetical protein